MHPQKCFFLELRHAKKAPNLKHLNLLNDPVIKKFISNTKAKHVIQHSVTPSPFVQIQKFMNSSSRHTLKNPTTQEEEVKKPKKLK